MTISGLPSVADSALPASVRTGSESDKQAYKAALGFEQMLVEQMVTTMAGDNGPLAEGPYANQMQTTLASAITGAGGLGLAQQLYKEIGDDSPADARGAIAQRAILPGGNSR